MKKTFRKAAAMAALAMTLTVGTTAFAAETDSSYGYLSGQQESVNRHAQFGTAAGMTTDADREAFLASQGIGGDGTYSSAQHLDAQELLDAGVIDQATAAKIEAAASSKQQGLHARYGSQSEMSPEERHTFFESFSNDGAAGDSVSELLNNGIITQEQADAINAYLAR